MYTATSAAAMSSGSLARAARNAWAVPWKLPWMLGGQPEAARRPLDRGDRLAEGRPRRQVERQRHRRELSPGAETTSGAVVGCARIMVSSGTATGWLPFAPGLAPVT
jgi:hypothetical protein